MIFIDFAIGLLFIALAVLTALKGITWLSIIFSMCSSLMVAWIFYIGGRK